MTEKVEEKVETKTDVVEPSATELAAQVQGWVPEEEWVESGREASDWRPAKEFLDRGELFKTIHSTKRDLKQTQAALTALQKHQQFMFDKGYQKALTDLKKEKRLAIKNEDFERLEAIEEEIEEVTEQHQEAKQEMAQVAVGAQVSGPHPDFVDWQSRNQWYSNDSDLREFADASGLIYFNKNPGISPQEVLKYVETSVRKKFPEKFGVKKAAPNAVAGVDRSGTSGRKAPKVSFELDEMEREIMTTLVKSGVMTEEQYIADLKKAKANG